MKNIKKIILILTIMLLLPGCVKSEIATPDQSVFLDSKEKQFSENELESIKINMRKSNYSNSFNLKGSVPGKMCFIPETETLFYSDNNGLFQKNGENIITLFYEPVMSINLAEGNLYFIIPDGDNHGRYGKVYQMDLSSGKIICIIDDNVTNIAVYKDRIFYLKNEVSQFEDGTYMISTSYHKCDLNGENNEQVFDYTFSFQENICVSANGSAINIIDLASGTNSVIASETDMVSELSLFNNCIYYIRTDNKTLNTTGVKINIADNSVTEYREKDVYFENYGFVNGNLCLYEHGGSFYLENNGKLEKYNCTETYSDIYSCGEKIYGLNMNGSLWELNFNNQNDIKTVSGNKIGGNESEA